MSACGQRYAHASARRRRGGRKARRSGRLSRLPPRADRHGPRRTRRAAGAQEPGGARVSVATKRVPLAAPRSFCAGVARLRLAPVGETMFPLRDPFFWSRLSPRAAEIAAWAEENER